jgi:soluble lytic murein transglycosylase-like protein
MTRRALLRFIPMGIGLFTIVAICAAASFTAERMAKSPTPETDRLPKLAPLFAPQVLTWEAEILRWSDGYGLNPNLVATVMQIESCGNPHAVSRSGAQGLFQVMPFHFSAGENMQDPEINAQRGLVYLGESLIKSEGDIRRTFAGYNGGHGVIQWDPARWPAETRRYAYWGEGIYSDAAAGRASSPRLEEWLAAGGYSLCEDASAENK